MTIISVKTGSADSSNISGAGFRRIELSDGSLFSFKTCYLPPVFAEDLYTPGLAEGREINPSEEAGFRQASACLRAEKTALRLIARAEQCLFGLRHKLERRGHDAACIGAVLARLAELQLIDDRRFARFWLETRMLRSSSPWRLLASLRSRGIDRNDAEAALKSVLDDETEFALLQRYVAKLRRSRAAGIRAALNGGRAASPKTAALPASGAPAAERSQESSFRSLKYILKNEGFSTAAVERFLEENT
jgi:regulatory protein